MWAVRVSQSTNMNKVTSRLKRIMVLMQVKGLPEEVWEGLEKTRERERRFEARDAKIQATKEVCITYSDSAQVLCCTAVKILLRFTQRFSTVHAIACHRG